MAQFVNKLRDCVRTVNLTMLLVLNLFFIVTLNLTVATVLGSSSAIKIRNIRVSSLVLL